MGKLKVRVTNSQWAGEGLVLTGGTHELDTSDLTDEQVAALGAAAAATVGVEVVDASAAVEKQLARAVEPDEESLKALAEAVAEGAWQEGQALQAELDAEALAAAKAAS